MELIVVIIIIGILGTLGFTQYTRFIEKGREAEARSVLGSIRTTAVAYNMERATYPTLVEMGLGVPAGCTDTKYDFSYAATGGTNTTAVATRCITGGKSKGPSAYTVTVDYEAGTMGSTYK